MGHVSISRICKDIWVMFLYDAYECTVDRRHGSILDTSSYRHVTYRNGWVMEWMSHVSIWRVWMYRVSQAREHNRHVLSSTCHIHEWVSHGMDESCFYMTRLNVPWLIGTAAYLTPTLTDTSHTGMDESCPHGSESCYIGVHSRPQAWEHNWRWPSLSCHVHKWMSHIWRIWMSQVSI